VTWAQTASGIGVFEVCFGLSEVACVEPLKDGGHALAGERGGVHERREQH
jgi:hypothetical protein